MTEKTLCEKMIEIPNEEGIWDGDMAAKEKDVKEFLKIIDEDSLLQSCPDNKSEEYIKAWRDCLEYFRNKIKKHAGDFK